MLLSWYTNYYFTAFSNDEMDPNMIRAAQGMIDGYFPPLSAVFAAAFNLQVVPDDTIDIAPPGCTLAPGQVVGPASLGKPDVGLLAFFIIRTSDGKGFVKYYSGLEKGLKGIDWDSPTEISKLNKWRHEVVRIEVEEEVTYGKIFKEVCMYPLQQSHKETKQRITLTQPGHRSPRPTTRLRHPCRRRHARRLFLSIPTVSFPGRG